MLALLEHSQTTLILAFFFINCFLSSCLCPCPNYSFLFWTTAPSAVLVRNSLLIVLKFGTFFGETFRWFSCFHWECKGPWCTLSLTGACSFCGVSGSTNTNLPLTVTFRLIHHVELGFKSVCLLADFDVRFLIFFTSAFSFFSHKKKDQELTTSKC